VCYLEEGQGNIFAILATCHACSIQHGLMGVNQGEMGVRTRFGVGTEAREFDE
jgi:hypothetical protein